MKLRILKSAVANPWVECKTDKMKADNVFFSAAAKWWRCGVSKWLAGLKAAAYNSAKFALWKLANNPYK